MLKGRLGLDTARVPHADRHGVIWLTRGNLVVEDGTLRFRTAGGGELEPGDYAIPYQTLSLIVLGPGSTVSHDALRLMARHGTGLVASGDDGVRAYTAMPLGPDDSQLARRQARVWADAEGARLDIARRLYAWRLGEILPHREIEVLRGIEGARWLRQECRLRPLRPSRSRVAIHVRRFQNELEFLRIESPPAFVRAPEGNGCAERFIRTLKENLLWMQTFDTMDELRSALIAFLEAHNITWLIQRHGFLSPAAFRQNQLQPAALAAQASTRYLRNCGRNTPRLLH